MATTWWFWTIAAYLCGSIPFALLLGRSQGIDVRKVGSGNVGATNLGRALGRRWGVGCFVLDVLKGAVPVLAAGWVMGWLGRRDIVASETWQWLAVAAAAVLGHVFPLWLKFRGGKGVATGLGVLLGFYPLLTLPGLLGAGVWIIIFKTTRYVSLASVCAALSLPVFVMLLLMLGHGRLDGALPVVLVTLALGILVTVRHRTNLARLFKGEEPKIEKR